MKANGTPTAHYRLDENQLIQKLGEFLNIMPLRIKMCMWTKTPNEDGQSRSSDEAELDQANELNQPDEFSEDEPVYSAETTNL